VLLEHYSKPSPRAVALFVVQVGSRAARPSGTAISLSGKGGARCVVSLNGEGALVGDGRHRSDGGRAGGRPGPERRVTARTLIRGGCVLTLGAKTPNYPLADLLVEDGRVAEVGAGLRARDAEVVDATDTIVMPGFVDTHRHTRTSLSKNLGDREGAAASEPVAGGGDRAEDVYASTLIALLGAAEAGITTVVDWSDLPDDDLATVALRAHADSGLRTVFVHVVGPRRRGDSAAAGRILDRLVEAAGPSTTVGVGFEEPGPSEPELSADELAPPRERGMPIHVHAASRHPGPGGVSRLAERGVLGPDVTLIHHTPLDDADLGAISSSEAAVSLAPSSEMAGGLGSPPIQQLIDHGVRPGLGVDDQRVASGDLFAQMRATISLQHATVFERKLAGMGGVPRLMTTRDVIRSATVDGVRVAGLGRVTGSLEPGMQADLIVLRADRPNVYPINDPIGAVVWGMDTSNVDWVFVGGRVVMREGALEADVHRARDLAVEARDRMVAGVVGAAPGSRP
jgi:cytosine/adenosine deaminase-related metal-dependent hydrolase